MCIYFKQVFIKKILYFNGSIINFLFFILLILFDINYPTSVIGISPKRSCRDHYLSGNFKNGIYPLTMNPEFPNKEFRVYCQFPEFGNVATHLSVVTIIRNALEQWFTLNKESQTVGYQIKDVNFLRTIVSESNNCFQDLLINWPSQNNLENLGITTQNPILSEFSIETINGKKQILSQNSSNSDRLIETIRINGSGILHIFPIKSSNLFSIRSSSLQCHQLSIPTTDCFFEIGPNSISESVLVNFRQIDISLYQTFAFSFRTDFPSANFLSLKTNLGETIQVDLRDGYLIVVNHLIHPVKLLSDGHWHRLSLDLKTLILSFDDDNGEFSKSVSISLIGSKVGAIAELQIQIFSQITAIQFLPKSKEGKIDDQWLCQKNSILSFVNSGKNLQPFFATRICWPGERMLSFCNCFGPNSALDRIKNGPAQIAKCYVPNNENFKGFHLSRNSDKLAFFFLPNFDPESSISVLFKSEKKTGLILFGTWNLMTSANNKIPISSRLQIHFVGEKMFIAKCSRYNDGNEKCYSCFIINNKDFDSGEFFRVSFFTYQIYQFLTVNERICQLSPNSPFPDSSELYKLSVSNLVASTSIQNALFVGGTYYSKLSKLNHLIDKGFQRDFQDNTREKAPSLKGCIFELIVAGQTQNLSSILEEQILNLRRKDSNNSSLHSIFSINSGNCQAKECLPVLANCQQNCGQIYSLNVPETDGCNNINTQLSRQESILLSYFASEENENVVKIKAQKNFLSQKLGAFKSMDRIWLWINLPKTREELWTLIEIGLIRIKVGSYGKIILIENDFGLKEEFTINNVENDERLHLIAIQQNPSIGLDGKSLTLRVDFDKRILFGMDEIPLNDPQIPFLIINPIKLETDKKILESSFGCLSEIGISLMDREDKTPSENSITQNLYNENHQQNSEVIDYLSLLLEDSDNLEYISSNNLKLIGNYCGIRDPTYWQENSSSFGKIESYIPDDKNYNYYLMTLLSIILTITLITLLLYLIFIYCIMRFKHQRNHRNLTKPHDENSDDENSQGKLTIENLSYEEKRPLKLDSHSNYPLNPTKSLDLMDGRSPSPSEYINEMVEKAEHQTVDPISPPSLRPYSIGRESRDESYPKNRLKNESFDKDDKYSSISSKDKAPYAFLESPKVSKSDSFQIDHLNSSPKFRRLTPQNVPHELLLRHPQYPTSQQYFSRKDLAFNNSSLTAAGAAVKAPHFPTNSPGCSAPIARQDDEVIG